jgi:hypothetical protein
MRRIALVACLALATCAQPEESTLPWGPIAIRRNVAMGRYLGVVYDAARSLSDPANRIAGVTVRLSNGMTVTTGASGLFDFRIRPDDTRPLPRGADGAPRARPATFRGTASPGEHPDPPLIGPPGFAALDALEAGPVPCSNAQG